MSLSTRSFEAHPPLHYDVDGSICPMCEQTIPNDRLDQVKSRQEQHRREVESQFALRLKSEQDQISSRLRQEYDGLLQRARQETTEKEAAARMEARQAADEEAQAKIASAQSETATQRAQAEELQRQLDANAEATLLQVNAAREQARQDAEAAVHSDLSAARSANEEAQAQLRLVSEREASAKDQIAQLTLDIAGAREQGRQSVEAETLARIQDLEAALSAADNRVHAAMDAGRREAEHAVQAQLASANAQAEQAQEQARVSAEREASARAEVELLSRAVETAREESQAAVAGELESAREAQATAEQAVLRLQAEQEEKVREAVNETRDALEQSHRDQLNAEQSKHFEDKLKFQNTVDDLRRQLEKQRSDELGEGAEIDLFEALKEAFPGDDITRIKKGIPGADIRHIVKYNGHDCGRILYDSKNHKSWRNDFVTKLRDDQIADQAEHAVLSTSAFPQGHRQFHVQDGVLLVNPARAVAVATVLRGHVIQTHGLQLSNTDRKQKSAKLYAFMTSERFATHMTKLQVTASALTKVDEDEQTAHRNIWKKRGLLIGNIAKAQADLRAEIDRIIGVDDVLFDDDAASGFGELSELVK